MNYMKNFYYYNKSKKKPKEIMKATEFAAIECEKK